ncbi:MAG TPA: response regulator [Abditibacteriaceae bacterium]|jgi:CheY-like chemotaxis protein
MNSDFKPHNERLGVAEEAEQKRILIIEGSLETADFLADLLESEGYAVEVATEGKYGLMVADRFEPHIILISLDLSGMSGHDFATVLRKEPHYAQRFRNTRMFFLSEKDQMISKRFDALPGTPMSDYIFKPIDVPELLDKAARALTNS